MQFLEWSILGLRSACHVFRHDEKGVLVTLFPMVHVGEAQFFETVYADAASHDMIVVEGIGSRTSARLTRVYRWARPSRLGLVIQPGFPHEDKNVVLADLPAAEFEHLWRKAPRLERALIEIGASLMGAWLALTATRKILGQSLNTTDLQDRDSIMGWNDQTAAIHTALDSARNDVLCKTVLDLIFGAEPPASIAVIYGAGHMGALRHALTTAGFHPVDSHWRQVFSA